MGRTFSPKTSSGSLFDLKSEPKDTFHESDPDFNNFTNKDRSSLEMSKDDTIQYPYNDKFSKTDGAALAKAYKQGGGTG